MISPLKILHILDHSLPLHDGYALRSHNILRSQRQRGWQPVALTSSKHEASVPGASPRQETLDGVRYYRTGALTHTAVPFVPESRIMVALTKRLREIIRLEKPHLLHAHSPILNALPALHIGRQLGLPLVYEMRAFWEDAGVDQGTYRPGSWKYQLVRAAETWVCRRADAITVLCHGIKQDLLKRGVPAEKLAVVFNGVNVDDFTICEPDRDYRQQWQLLGKQVVGFIGSFYRYEGLDLLVEAVARLVATHRNVVLLLVGGGEMEGALKAQIQQLGMEAHVRMPGRIPHHRIPGVYGLVDILAYPRYATRLTELVTPLKPLEAMAMGKALVASDIGGHRELIRQGHTGLLFTPGNITALVAALKRLLDDQAYRQHLAKQEYTWVYEEHTWEKTTAVYTDVYAQVLASHAVHSKPPQRS